MPCPVTSESSPVKNNQIDERPAGPSRSGPKAGIGKADPPACIKSHISINSNPAWSVHLGLRYILQVYPGYTEFKNDHREYPPKQEDRPKRGKVTDFSDKSRLSMLKKLSRVQEPFTHWIDLTFHDECMEALTITERGEYAKECLNRFLQTMRNNGLDVYTCWKMECQKRKSGMLLGEWIPHFHILFGTRDNTGRKWGGKRDYTAVHRSMATYWVKAMQLSPGAVIAAYKVASDDRSFRAINSRKDAVKYMTKYVTKRGGESILQKGDTDESIGRCWGMTGNIVLAAAETIDMSYEEMVMFKRIARRLCRRAKGWFKATLSDPHTPGFIFIDKRAIDRYLEWARKDKEGPEGVPF